MTQPEPAPTVRRVDARHRYEILVDGESTGLRAVPVCPYVAKFLKKHEEYADLPDPVTPEVLEWLDGVLKR
ncbi:N-acetyltransferase [Streptomyces sp. PA5.6]|uniref:N-acetyltransferase n=1 Tax=Streptomyces sp. PA5.6 TaxID=3035651 RepID=UPI0039047CE7